MGTWNQGNIARKALIYRLTELKEDFWEQMSLKNRSTNQCATAINPRARESTMNSQKQPISEISNLEITTLYTARQFAKQINRSGSPHSLSRQSGGSKNYLGRKSKKTRYTNHMLLSLSQIFGRENLIKKRAENSTRTLYHHTSRILGRLEPICQFSETSNPSAPDDQCSTTQPKPNQNSELCSDNPYLKKKWTHL